MNTIPLPGCTAEPLGSYLKAIGVLKLVGEQKDPNARGRWEDGLFVLETALDKDALVRFLVDEYRPTPVVAPWNGGSGFYFQEEKLREIDPITGNRRKTGKRTQPTEATRVVAALLASSTPRLASYRETLQLVKSVVAELGLVEAPESEGKQELIKTCRNRLSDQAIAWLDASVVLTETKPQYPPLLGTGGNEGNLDYTTTFMKSTEQLIVDPKGYDFSIMALQNALFGDVVDNMAPLSTGQFDPGRAGGYNQGFGVEQKDFPTNPWNFILTIEGAIGWSSGAGKRYATGGQQIIRTPFTVQSKPVGYDSSAPKDDAKGEIWAPLWSRPLRIKEMRAFIGEGRSDVGRRAAHNTIEFAEAVSSLGVDRGVQEFARFALLKRRGKSYLALPAGRFPVCFRREADLIRELDSALWRLDSFMRQFQEIPASLSTARNNIDEAVYQALLHGGEVRMKHVLSAIGKMEQVVATRDPTKEPKLKTPLTGLSPQWLLAADDGCIEVRLAAALASIGRTNDVGPLRANIEPVDPSKPFSWGNGQAQMAWIGGNLSARLASVLARRMMDADRTNCQSNPLRADISVTPEDISSFIEGRVDETLLQDLLFGFMLIKWDNRPKVRSATDELHQRWHTSGNGRIVDRSWAILKLLFLPYPLRIPEGKAISIRPEPSIVPLLRAGRTGDACEIAKRRLMSAGLTPTTARFQDLGNGIRIAAALLIPSTNPNGLLRMATVQNDKKNAM
jgi:CRISPR-associated protein Csx17